MPPEIQVPTGLTTDGLLGRRYVERFIDSIIIVLLIALITLGWTVVVSGRSASLSDKLVFSLLLFFGWISYGTILESSKVQATLGKRIMGLRVYNAQGGRLELMQAAGRNVVKDGPFLVLGLIPGMAGCAPRCHASQPRLSSDSRPCRPHLGGRPRGDYPASHRVGGGGSGKRGATAHASPQQNLL
jgi:uncharacterized RDD family membrane protein YckC